MIGFLPERAALSAEMSLVDGEARLPSDNMPLPAEDRMSLYIQMTRCPKKARSLWRSAFATMVAELERFLEIADDFRIPEVVELLPQEDLLFWEKWEMCIMRTKSGVRALGILGLVLFGLSAEADPAREMSSLEQALLSEDWAKVVEKCDNPSQLSKEPVMRAILGHACLALNRNNQSLDMFRSVAPKDDQMQWENWTRDFTSRADKSPLSHYLYADALARSDNWDGAIRENSAALRLRKDYALALNARGVAYACTGAFKQALDDFEAACNAKPGLADAHANLGTVLIIKEAASGALEQFELALRSSPSFALAQNGQGCARLGYSRDEETLTKALADFALALRCESSKTMAEANIELVRHLYVGEGTEDSTVKGTTMNAQDIFSIRQTKGPEAARNAFNSQPLPTQQKITSEARFNAQLDAAKAAIGGFRTDQSINVGLKAGPVGGEAGARLRVDPSGFRAQSLQSEQVWKEVSILGKVDPTGMAIPGGGDTAGAALAQSVGDIGPWPAKNTCFGLFPNVPLPPNH